MNARTAVLLLATHSAIGISGVGVGIYTLPILTAPPAPKNSLISNISANAMFTGKFSKSLKDSDIFHWGEGTLSVGNEFITLMGALAPGPDYRLYLSPVFVETEVDFNRHKSSMIQVGNVKTFKNFVVNIPPGINPSKFNTAIVWCESFGQFITSARYQ